MTVFLIVIPCIEMEFWNKVLVVALICTSDWKWSMFFTSITQHSITQLYIIFSQVKTIVAVLNKTFSLLLVL